MRFGDSGTALGQPGWWSALPVMGLGLPEEIHTPPFPSQLDGVRGYWPVASG